MATHLAEIEAKLVQKDGELSHYQNKKVELEAQLEDEWLQKGVLETCLVSSVELVDKKDKEILKAAMMVKSTRECQIIVENNLKLR